MKPTTTVTTKHVSRVSNIFLREDSANTFSLEVITEFIHKEIIETVFGNRKEETERILSRRSESTIYPMRVVSAQELFNLRVSKAPGIVYKKNGILFYTKIPSTLHINGRDSLGAHLCGKHCSQVCQGCPRTSALTVDFQEKSFEKDFVQAVKDSWRIEKYDFVFSALEAFNMENSNDACLIFNCDNFNVKTPEHGNITEKKLRLAGAYWDDFNSHSITEMRARIRENERKYKLLNSR